MDVLGGIAVLQPEIVPDGLVGQLRLDSRSLPAMPADGSRQNGGGSHYWKQRDS
jgi:hypothetical protein